MYTKKTNILTLGLAIAGVISLNSQAAEEQQLPFQGDRAPVHAMENADQDNAFQYLVDAVNPQPTVNQLNVCKQLQTSAGASKIADPSLAQINTDSQG
jgi:hypothetical protein